jgi:hypothetical protein
MENKAGRPFAITLAISFIDCRGWKQEPLVWLCFRVSLHHLRVHIETGELYVRYYTELSELHSLPTQYLSIGRCLFYGKCIWHIRQRRLDLKTTGDHRPSSYRGSLHGDDRDCQCRWCHIGDCPRHTLISPTGAHCARCRKRSSGSTYEHGTTFHDRLPYVIRRDR